MGRLIGLLYFPLYVKKKSGPRQRILEQALVSMFQEGVHNITVNRVIEESGAYKKSFYRYFNGIEDLQEAYLEAQRSIFLGFLERLCEKHTGFPEFWRAWTGLLLKQASRNKYPGCQFARFAAQTEKTGKNSATMNDFISRWITILSDFMRKTNPALARQEADERALRLMYLFEGAVNVYSMTGDLSHLKKLAEMGVSADA